MANTKYKNSFTMCLMIGSHKPRCSNLHSFVIKKKRFEVTNFNKSFIDFYEWKKVLPTCVHEIFIFSRVVRDKNLQKSTTHKIVIRFMLSIYYDGTDWSHFIFSQFIHFQNQEEKYFSKNENNEQINGSELFLNTTMEQENYG